MDMDIFWDLYFKVYKQDVKCVWLHLHLPNGNIRRGVDFKASKWRISVSVGNMYETI